MSRLSSNARVGLAVGLGALLLGALTHPAWSDGFGIFGDVRSKRMDAHDQLAARDWQRATATLEALVREAEGRPEGIEALILLGKARLARKDVPGAIEAWDRVVRRHETSPWAEKARFLIADARALSRQSADAAEGYRERAAFLTSEGYRARVAALYLELADKSYDGVKHGKEGDPLDPPRMVHDYPRALAMYLKAEEVGVDTKRKADVAHRIARSLAELGRVVEAAARWEALLREHPDTPAAAEATYRLGRVRLQLGQVREGRALLARIEEAFGDAPEAPLSVIALGESYRPGASPDKEALREGTAHWRRFLVRYQDHAEAASVHLRLARALHQGGELEAAISSYHEVTARFPGTDQAADALYAIGTARLQRTDYEGAREAWRAFLAAHPSHPRFVEAQRAIVQALYQRGADALAASQYVAAASAWRAFLGEYPVDALAPSAALGIGQAIIPSGDYAKAIDALRTAATKYRGSSEAPEAQQIAADLLAGHGSLAEAIEAYEHLIQTWPRSPQAQYARNVLAEMRQETLRIASARAYTTQEELLLDVVTRNVAELTYKAYRLDLLEYFKKKHRIDKVEDLAIDIVSPDKTRVANVTGYEPYRLIERQVPLELANEGAYVIVCEDGARRAIALALRSDIAIVTKQGPRELLVWAKDERTGAPAPGVDVLVSDGRAIVGEGKTDKDGVFVKRFDSSRGRLHVLAHLEQSFAFSSVQPLSAPSWGYKHKVFLYTDRPVYRPGQRVHFRGIARKALDDRYEVDPKGTVTVEVRDAKGLVHARRDLALNAFGSFSADFVLAEEPPLGAWEVRARYDGRDFTQSFHVEAYVKPEMLIEVTPLRADTLAGEEVRARIGAAYSFGGEVRRAPVTYTVWRRPYGFDASRYEGFAWFFAARDAAARHEPEMELVHQGEAETDDRGQCEIAFPTPASEEDHVYLIAASVLGPSQRWAQGAANAFVTAKGFFSVVKVDKKVYRPREAARVTVHIVDAAHRGVAATGELVLYRRREIGGSLRDDPIERRPVTVDASGKADVELRVEAPGEYRVAFQAKDRRGSLVEGAAPLLVSGDAEDLAKEAKLVFERAVYTRGERATLVINAPAAPIWALVTFEGERVLEHRVVRLDKRSTTLTIEMVDAYSPNVFAEVALAHEHTLFRSGDEVAVLKYLEVEVKSDRAELKPGERVKLSIRTTDHAGQPVPAEVSVGVVDEMVYAIRPDQTPEIQPFFYDQRRAHAIRTESSFDWSHEGVTAEIAKELLVEQERRMLEERMRSESLSARDRISRSADAGPMAPPMPAAAPAMEAMAEEAFSGAGGRAMRKAAPGAMMFADEGADGSAANMVPPTLRQRFADTAYWKPDVVTGRDGTATVEVDLPDNLTHWRVTVRGATKDTLVGAGEGRFATRKPVVVELRLPRFLHVGDRSSVAAIAQNQTAEALDARLELSVGALAAEGTTRLAAKLPPGELARHEQVVTAPTAGATKVRADLLTAKASDAVELPLVVRHFGEVVRAAQSGRLGDAPVRFAFEVPEGAIPDTAEVVLALNPSLAIGLADALGYLETYPYGCVEQTVNRFAPLAAAADAMRRAGVELGRARIESALAQGVQRLVQLQQPNGGWGWWAEGEALPETTALALEGLEVAAAAGFFVDPNALARARSAGRRLVTGSAASNPDAAAALLRALALSRNATTEDLARGVRAADSMSTIGLASLAIACARADRRDMALGIVERLRGEARRSDDGVSWRAAEGRGWWCSEIEATARAAQALLLYDPTSALIDDAMRWLESRRRGGAWASTKDTAAVVAAIAAYLGDRGAGRTERTVVVKVDGREVARAELKGGAGVDQRRRLRIGAADLPKGRRVIEVEARGTGALAYTLQGTVLVQRDEIAAAGNLLEVERKVVRWIPPEPKRDALGRPREPGHTILEPKARPSWREEEALTEVAASERLVVRLAVTAREEVSYVVIESPLPAGLEAETEGATGPLVRYEARDDRAVFFAERLAKGTHLFSFDARAVRPGRYRALPATAAGMYEPEVHGRSASLALAVVEGAPARRELTPDEIYARALDLFDERAYAAAEPLVDGLLGLALRAEIRDELLVKTVVMRLARRAYRDAVTAYEALLDKNPPLARVQALDVTTGMGIGESYLALKDGENALSIFRGLVRGRFDVDVQVADVYRGMGQELPAQGYLASLVRRYPDQDYVIDRWFQVARRYYDLDRPASDMPKHAAPDPRQRKMYVEAVEALREFVGFHPESPWADDAAYLVGLALYQLGQFDLAAIELAKVPARYLKSEYTDDALYHETLSHYEQAMYPRALEVGQRLLAWQEVLPDGRRRASPFVPQVQHLFAKVHHLRGNLDEAVRYYKLVAGRYPDAQDALAFLTDRGVEVPPVLSVAPGGAKLPVRFKNLKTLSARLYPVDLLLLFAKEKDLAKIAKVDLTGIAPRSQREVTLAGKPYDWSEQLVDLGVTERGAYLVVAKADDLDASALVILSDIDLRIQHLPQRTRVYLTSRSTGKPVDAAYVTVADGARVLARGRTDARGVFEAPGRGSSLSVVAEKEGHYALYRQGLTDR